MSKFWVVLFGGGLVVVAGGVPLLITLLLTLAVYVVLSNRAEVGLGRSVENAKKELAGQSDPDKARALSDFVEKLESHRRLIGTASLGLTLSVLFIVGHPAILLVWLIWMVVWRVLAYTRLRHA